MEDVIKAIISDGIQAPSGENCQPWKFFVKDSVIELFLLPERDQSLYSWGQRASYMANGAMLENIEISANYHGYNAAISLFPDLRNIHLIAKIQLTKSSGNKKKIDLLYNYIRERSTNRRPYESYVLSSAEVSDIERCSDNLSKIKVHMLTDNMKLKILGAAGAVNEDVMLSNEHLHNFFFSHVNWTKEEDDKKKIGFFIDTLELPPPAKIGFRILRSWRITNILNMFGCHRLIGMQNANVNAKASGFGIITVDNMSAETFVKAGRVLQKVWLLITKQQLSLQPLTGILFFMHKIRARETEMFSSIQISKIENAYNDIKNSFNLSNSDTIVFMFRVGKARKPTAQSVRFSVDDVVEFI